VKAPAASPSRRCKKIAPGQPNFTFFHVLELKVTAHAKDDPDAHNDVRVLPFLSNTSEASAAGRSARARVALESKQASVFSKEN
jgi:hypothetical protein